MGLALALALSLAMPSDVLDEIILGLTRESVPSDKPCLIEEVVRTMFATIFTVLGLIVAFSEILRLI